MHKISICIPTFNRCNLLANCLNSIILNTNYQKENIQVCVSDNCSTDNTDAVVRHAQKELDIVYSKNETNIGLARNFLKVVGMADGEYVWIIGDDDLLIPNALEKLLPILYKNHIVDFFYINSFNLTTEDIFNYPQPFHTKNLPSNMNKFSSYQCEMKIDFLDLIDPKISFDFLGGMFLSVFKREKWMDNIDALDSIAINDDKIFSHFDNTFPHVKIFAQAFCNSKAYFYSTPLSVSLSGAREWAPMYPFIRSVRLIEALDEYRRHGLPYWKFLIYKNFALRNFIPDMLYMLVYKEESGYKYIQPLKLLSNIIYPEFYLSFFRFIFKFKNLKRLIDLVTSKDNKPPIK
jgi:glycosyltransferase involved in cell wall biosynthesis